MVLSLVSRGAASHLYWKRLAAEGHEDRDTRTRLCARHRRRTSFLVCGAQDKRRCRTQRREATLRNFVKKAIELLVAAGVFVRAG